MRAFVLSSLLICLSGCNLFNVDNQLKEADQTFATTVGDVVVNNIPETERPAYQDELEGWKAEGSDWTTWNMFAPEYVEIQDETFSNVPTARQSARDVLGSWEDNIQNRRGSADVAVYEVPQLETTVE